MSKTRSVLATTLAALVAAGVASSMAQPAVAAPSQPNSATALKAPVTAAARAKIVNAAIKAARTAPRSKLSVTPPGMLLPSAAAKAAAPPADVSPAQVGFAANRVFGRGTDGLTYFRDTAPGSGWRVLGDAVASGPTAIDATGPGEPTAVLLFARGKKNDLVLNVQDDGDPVDYAWDSLGGGLASAPSATVDGEGIQIAARGGDGAIWLRTFAFDGENGTWLPWRPLGGGSSSGPSITAHPGIGTIVATRGSDGNVYERNIRSGAWSRLKLPTISSRPEVNVGFPEAGPRMSYGWRGSDGALYLDTQDGGTVRAGGSITSGATISVTTGGAYNRETYARAGDNAIWRYLDGDGVAPRWERLGGRVS